MRPTRRYEERAIDNQTEEVDEAEEFIEELE
jgi:hypothetical protein